MTSKPLEDHTPPVADRTSLFIPNRMKLLNLTGKYFDLIALIDLSLEQLHKMITYCLLRFLWDLLGFIDADVSDSL